MSRAQRRHDTRRIKARFYMKQRKQECWLTSEKNAGLFANHGKVCSCWVCGNPRKQGLLTMQELRAVISTQE